MKRLIFLVFFLVLCQSSLADQRFIDWSVTTTSNGNTIAATVQDNADKMLAYICYKKLNSCVHVLMADIACVDGQKYPVLVNSNTSALAMIGLCVAIENGKFELVLTEFDNIHRLLQQSSTIGFAVPMESGLFKVVRFSLNGSSKAMDYAEKSLNSRSEYL